MNQVLTVVGSNNVLTVSVDEVHHLTVNTESMLTITEVNAQLLTIAQQGPPGPKGDKGDTADISIGGYVVDVSELTSGDVLSFTGSNWANVNQLNLTDGGNF